MRVRLRDEKDVQFRHMDGTVYPAQDGVIEVDNATHAAQLDAASKHGDIVKVLPKALGFTGVAGVTCTRCLFEQFACLSDRPCPRCGASF
jgi:hypothetical protein